MALTLTEIQAVTDDVWLPGAKNQWAMGNILMYKMLGKVQTIGSAEKVRAVLEYAKANGGAMGATTVFDTTKKEIVNAARFPWAYFYSGNSVDILDETQASGGDADVDLTMAKLDNAQKTIRDIMGDSFWALYATALVTYGATTKPFYGIADLLNQSDTTPKFGDIAQADLGTYTDGSGTSRNIWQSGYNSDALTMNFETMQKLRRLTKVGDGAGEKADLYITTETLKDAFENSLQAAQRHNDPTLVKAGFDNVMFGSTPLVADDKCSSGDVIALNTNYLYLKAHKDFNFTKPVWKQPTNQYAKTFQIIWSGAFCTSQRRAHAKLDTVS